MKPHGRIVLAAAAFSTSVALALFCLSLVALYWLQNEPPMDPPDNGPIRGLRVMFVVGIPASFVVSLLVAVPYTYVAWARRPVTRLQVAGLVAAASIAPALPLAYVGLGLKFSPINEFLGAFCSVFAAAALVFGFAATMWWLSAPRALTTRSSERAAGSFF